MNDVADYFKDVLVMLVIEEWSDVVCKAVKEMFCSFANPLTN